jgi:hypothetical protein
VFYVCLNGVAWLLEIIGFVGCWRQIDVLQSCPLEDRHQNFKPFSKVLNELAENGGNVECGRINDDGR